MDKRKQKMLQKKQEEQQKELKQNPAFQYINYSSLEFPRLKREEILNEYGILDDKLQMLLIEVQILEEQIELRNRIKLDLELGRTDIPISNGTRPMSISELKVQRKLCTAAAWQSKSNIEKLLTDMIQLVGVPLPQGGILISEEEHNAIAMTVINRVEKNGIKLFKANKEKILQELRGE